MPAILTQPARLFALALELPGQGPVNAGVLLEDPSTDRLYVRLRRDWETFAADLDPEEAEVLGALCADLEAKAAELGAARLLASLQDTLSNVLRITEPREVIVGDFERALGRHYREQVHSEVRPFQTHLPRYTLAVAAGRFLENQEVTEEAWEEAPAGLRLDPAMFVARIQGTSMEPRIPDGSLCVFRAGVAGSRQGRLVLVEKLGGGANDRYTVKRYTSVKRAGDGDEWSHERIRLEPLNPEHEAWDLDPEEGRFRVIAEFVQVLA